MTVPKKPSSSMQPEWPDFLDALVAASDHHELLFENDRVRVLSTHIAAGERTSVHTHRWPATSYVQSWSDFVRYDDKGKVLNSNRKCNKG